MDRHVIRDSRRSRGGFTWKETLAVVVVVGVLLALLVQGVLIARESVRRISCKNNMKQIGFGLHNYTQANNVFPPGTICATEPIAPGNQYDVWAEAAQTGQGSRGTSFLPCIMSYGFAENIARFWDYSEGVSSTKREKHDYSNFDLAILDVSGLYCPSRRKSLRPEDKPMMLSPAWTGGGTDYGGCAGRHAAFTLQTGYNICDASTRYEPNYYPTPFTADDDTEEKRWGMFGRVNVSTTTDEIIDGTSNTIMTGELQRITDITPGSKDGWAIGGPATLFTTGAMFRYDGGKLECVSSPDEGKLLNNRFFGSPGSAHSGGANFGLADCSVQFLTDEIDPRIFALLGSMADGAEASANPQARSPSP